MTISLKNGSCYAGSIVSVKISDDGDLIVKYNNGLVTNIGRVKGDKGDDGKNFQFDEITTLRPDESSYLDKPIGFSCLYIGTDEVLVYFKSNEENNTTTEWSVVEFGKGDKGDDGKNFEPDVISDVKPTVTMYNDKPIGFKYLYIGDDEVYLYFKKNSPSDISLWVKTDFKGDKGDKGDVGVGEDGKDGKDGTKQLTNVVNVVYPNALLVVGKCPANYVVNEIEVKVLEGFQLPVETMFVRFGGTMQSDDDSVVIAPADYFDIMEKGHYIVSGVYHEPSEKEEIIACVFDDSVNNSQTGKLLINITLVQREPIKNINDNI